MVDGFLTPIHGNHNSIQKAFDWLRSQDPDQTDFFDRLIRRFDIDQFIDYLAIKSRRKQGLASQQCDPLASSGA